MKKQFLTLEIKLWEREVIDFYSIVVNYAQAFLIRSQPLKQNNSAGMQNKNKQERSSSVIWI